MFRAAYAFEQDLGWIDSDPESEARTRMSTTTDDCTRRRSGSRSTSSSRPNSKMFCGCEVAFGGEPNTRTCPVCLGMPGSLPVAEREGDRVHDADRGWRSTARSPTTRLFHRKNYFYPDMPKNYQISPVRPTRSGRGASSRSRATSARRKVGINRVHLEEDTGKSIHVGGSGRIADSDYSLEDFNRAGTPLVEIVIGARHPLGRGGARVRDRAAGAARIARRVRRAHGGRLAARRRERLGASAGREEYGAKVEVKNMNSIRSVGRALEYEEQRQREALDAGETLIQETRHFDEKTGTTSSLRTKEFAFDYRYFPEPDLVPFEPARRVGRLGRGESLPELPAAAPGALRRRSTDSARRTSRSSRRRGRRGTGSRPPPRRTGATPRRSSNWIIADLFGLLNEAGHRAHRVEDRARAARRAREAGRRRNDLGQAGEAGPRRDVRDG